MVEQVTKGIKISVIPEFQGTNFRNNTLYYIFSYAITIQNNSKDTVQLTRRYWRIFDSLNKTEIVEGEGVVGETPILLPNEEHTYSSGCFLESNIGSMSGFYTMKNIETDEIFKVYVPTFQLTAPLLSN